MEFHPTPDAFRQLAAQGNLIPVSAEFVADGETPVSAFHKLNDGGPAFLLESAEHLDKGGRYSFLGTEPRAIFESRGRIIKITDETGTRTFETESDPLAELERLMERYKPVPMEGLPRFTGGAVGFLGYDVVRFFEPSVPAAPPDAQDLPESVFFIAETLLVFDHQRRRLRIVSNAHVEGDPDAAYRAACGKIEAVFAKLQRTGSLPVIDIGTKVNSTEPRSNTTQAEYMAMVEKAKEFIRAGDAFQVVPSQRFETEYTGDPLTLYRCLRFVNPSPYLFCLQFGNGFSIVGSSPEVHVRAIDGKVEIRPIAGTKPRGATEEQDGQNARLLLADPKERAEHVMLVDLARNDVGRIADYASVRVTDFMTIERYSHVMHIVSNVEGRLREGSTPYDVMRATFPAGTVSGSPKVRAMQIINELEKNKRGVYAGAIGYFGFDGHHDSCIALRTVVLKNGMASVQAGAGVVADSDPASEHQECVNKAMGMMRAIELAKAVEGTRGK